ncbi:MAG: TonB-dependent receptor [Sphingomonas sp.]
MFGQLTWEALADLRLTAGLRYSRERRHTVGPYKVFNFNPVAPANVGPVYDLDQTDEALTPRFAIDYKPVENLLLYVSATRGFKSGAQVLPNAPVRPEFIWAYEAGAKLTAFDRRLQLDVAGFYYDYSDLQVSRPQGNHQHRRQRGFGHGQGSGDRSPRPAGGLARPRSRRELSRCEVRRLSPACTRSTRAKARSTCGATGCPGRPNGR